MIQNRTKQMPVEREKQSKLSDDQVRERYLISKWHVKEEPKGVCISPDSKFIAVAFSKGRVNIYSIPSASTLYEKSNNNKNKSEKNDQPFFLVKILPGQPMGLSLPLKPSFSGDSSLFVCGSPQDSSHLKLVPKEEKEFVVENFTSHQVPAHALVFWNTSDWTLHSHEPCHTDTPLCVTFCQSNSNLLASVSEDKTVQVFDNAKDPKKRKVFDWCKEASKEFKNWTAFVCFDEENQGKRVAVAVCNSTVNIYLTHVGTKLYQVSESGWCVGVDWKKDLLAYSTWDNHSAVLNVPPLLHANNNNNNENETENESGQTPADLEKIALTTQTGVNYSCHLTGSCLAVTSTSEHYVNFFDITKGDIGTEKATPVAERLSAPFSDVVYTCSVSGDNRLFVVGSGGKEENKLVSVWHNPDIEAKAKQRVASVFLIAEKGKEGGKLKEALSGIYNLKVLTCLFVA